MKETGSEELLSTVIILFQFLRERLGIGFPRVILACGGIFEGGGSHPMMSLFFQTFFYPT